MRSDARALRRRRVLLIALALLGAGCSSGARGPVRLFESEAGRTVDLSVGETLEVRLGSNPSTGYHWVWGDSTGSLLERMGPPEFEPTNDGFGGRGTDIWRFRAATAGTGTLALVYKRPMSSDVAERGVRYSIKVRPAAP